MKIIMAMLTKNVAIERMANFHVCHFLDGRRGSISYSMPLDLTMISRNGSCLVLWGYVGLVRGRARDYVWLMNDLEMPRLSFGERTRLAK